MFDFAVENPRQGGEATMTTNEQKIKCPNCGASISIDDVLTRQIEEKIKESWGKNIALKEAEIARQKKELEEPKTSARGSAKECRQRGK